MDVSADIYDFQHGLALSFNVHKTFQRNQAKHSNYSQRDINASRSLLSYGPQRNELQS